MLTEREAGAVVHAFYNALVRRNMEKILSLCSEDVSLQWAHYRFAGKANVAKWTTEFWDMFPKIFRIVETKLVAQKNEIHNEFVMTLLGRGGRKAVLPLTGTYVFHESLIQKIVLSPSWGILIFTEEEAKKLGIQKSR